MTKEIWHFHQWNNVCLIDIYVECTASHVHSWLWADGMFWDLHKRPHKLENDISKPFHHQSSAATVAYKWSVFNSSKRLKWHSSYLQIHKSHLKWHEYMFAECKMCEIFHNRKWIFPTITDFMHEKCTKIVDDKFSTPIMTIQWNRYKLKMGKCTIWMTWEIGKREMLERAEEKTTNNMFRLHISTDIY